MIHDVQRWDETWYGEDYGGMAHNNEGRFVRAADAEVHEKAAVAAAEQRHSDAEGSLLAAAFDDGERYMLAKCIAVVEAYADERLVKTRQPNVSEDITAALRVAASRLRALLDGTDTPPPLPPSVGIPEKP